MELEEVCFRSSALPPDSGDRSRAERRLKDGETEAGTGTETWSQLGRAPGLLPPPQHRDSGRESVDGEQRVMVSTL